MAFPARAVAAIDGIDARTPAALKAMRWARAHDRTTHDRNLLASDAPMDPPTWSALQSRDCRLAPPLVVHGVYEH